MKYLRAIKIIHDRKNRGLYNVIAEFFRFVGVFVLEDAPGYLNDTQKIDDTQFDIYLYENETELLSLLNEKPHYSIIVNNQKLNTGINNLTLQETVLVNAKMDLHKLFKSIFNEIQKSGIIVPSNVIGDLLPIYLNANIVIAASNLQYYRILSAMHEKSKSIFQDAVEELNALYNVTNGVSREDSAQAEFHYYYSLLYCKYKVNLACWFIKNGEYNRRRGDGELCDANGFRREVQLQYKVFDLVEECRKLLAKYPQEPNLYVLLGLITERASDGYSICVDAYTRALQSIGEQPYASHVYYWLGKGHEKHMEKNKEKNKENIYEAKRAYAKAYLLQKKYRNTYKVAVMYEKENNWPRFFEYLKKCKAELEKVFAQDIPLDPLELDYYCKVCLLLCMRSWQYLNDADAAIQYGEEVLKFFELHIKNDGLGEFQRLYGKEYTFYQRESQNRISFKHVHETLAEAYRSKDDMVNSELHRVQY